MNSVKFKFLLLLVFVSAMCRGQHTTEWVDGYILGKDTVKCKIQVGHHISASVTALVDGDESTFTASSGIVKNFGFLYKGNYEHYGLVSAQMESGMGTNTREMFIRKIVTGKITLYEHKYSVTTTRTVRTTKPGTITNDQPSSSKTNYTNYYISKTDSADTGLSTPVILNGFRKKDLEPYLKDNPAIIDKIEKKISLDDLLLLLNEYNQS